MATTNISGNPVKYDFSILQGNAPRQKRGIELQFSTAPQQVLMYFGDAAEIEFVSNDGSFLELNLPVELLADCLYLLGQWPIGKIFFMVAYNNATYKITNFALHSA